MEETKVREEQKKLFEALCKFNANEHTEKKKVNNVELTYLSWSWAWQAFKTICPDATYEIKQFADKDGVLHCYQYDEDLGYMVFTSITAMGLTHEMWLPVMDGANKAMKKEPYTYRVGFGDKMREKTCEAASMFDVNKTIMRCLVKNIAMFGLGLYLYAGEDLPTSIEEPTLCTAEQLARIRELKINEQVVCSRYKVKKVEELTTEDAALVIKTKEDYLKKQQEQKKQEEKAKEENKTESEQK